MRFQSLDPPIARVPRPEVPIHGVTWLESVALPCAAIRAHLRIFVPSRKRFCRRSGSAAQKCS